MISDDKHQQKTNQDPDVAVLDKTEIDRLMNRVSSQKEISFPENVTPQHNMSPEK